MHGAKNCFSPLNFIRRVAGWRVFLAVSCTSNFACFACSKPARNIMCKKYCEFLSMSSLTFQCLRWSSTWPWGTFGGKHRPNWRIRTQKQICPCPVVRQDSSRSRTGLRRSLCYPMKLQICTKLENDLAIYLLMFDFLRKY